MAQTRIFISHSHHDNEWCRGFAAALAAIGYDVWFDEAGLQGGDAWVASIQREVQSREIFVIVLTPEAWQSQWVQDELQLAIATRRRILPVLLRNIQVSGFLLTTQWITVIGEEPQAAARAAVLTIEAPPAPGRNAAPQATTETLDDLMVLCRSLATEGRYTEALSACARALTLDPMSAGVLVIKAWVLHAIGEDRLEGRTLYELLSANPNNSYLWGQERLEVMFRNLSEDEVLRAYSQLYSAASNSSRTAETAAVQVLMALQRLNRIETAIDVLAQTGGRDTRMAILVHLNLRRRQDLALGLLETWYGSPPTGATLDDIPLLDVYAKMLASADRANEARPIYEHIVRIVEEPYGNALYEIPSAHGPSWNVGDRNALATDTIRIYLAALDATGRIQDASRLRKAYFGSPMNDR